METLSIRGITIYIDSSRSPACVVCGTDTCALNIARAHVKAYKPAADPQEEVTGNLMSKEYRGPAIIKGCLANEPVEIIERAGEPLTHYTCNRMATSRV